MISALPARAGQHTGETITYEQMYIDQAGRSDYAVRITKHLAQGGRVTRISGSTFRGGRRAQIGLPHAGNHPQLYDIVDCRLIGNKFWLADDCRVPHPATRDGPGAGPSYTVRRAGRPGTQRRAWNASVERREV